MTIALFAQSVAVGLVIALLVVAIIRLSRRTTNK